MFEHIHDPKARVRALCEFGGQVEVDPTIPPKRYFKSGHEMLRMATVYLEEKKFEQAFILYTKFITLFVEKLPKHPNYKTATVKEKQANTQKLKVIFPKAEQLKTKLTQIYELEEKQRQAIQKKKDEELARQAEEERQREEARKANLKKQADEEDQRIREQFGAQMIREQEEQYRRLQEQERDKLKDKEKEDRDPESRLDDYMAGNRPDQQGEYPSVPPPAYGSVLTDQVSATDIPVRPDVPGRHLKPTAPLPEPVTSPVPVPQSPVPSVDRSNKPSHHFTSAGGSVNAQGLKKVWIPSELMVKFLNIAQPNTQLKLETGGFLFGKFSNEEFRITHLIVIKQKGEPDSFKDLSDEDELWELQEKYNIVQLGWIHTHPTQTAFLSSVDQHVQASFQCMLPESIAIVCSPKFEETGVFNLSPDYGLDFVRKCTGKGFHPHPSSPAIFETCSHAVIDPIGKVTVIDLRT